MGYLHILNARSLLTAILISLFPYMEDMLLSQVRLHIHSVRRVREKVMLFIITTPVVVIRDIHMITCYLMHEAIKNCHIQKLCHIRRLLAVLTMNSIILRENAQPNIWAVRTTTDVLSIILVHAMRVWNHIYTRILTRRKQKRRGQWRIISIKHSTAAGKRNLYKVIMMTK